MPKEVKPENTNVLKVLIDNNYLFRGMEESFLSQYLPLEILNIEKFFSNRPIYTAFMPEQFLDILYVIVDGGPVIIRSNPLDRIIAISYGGGCFGMRSLPLSYGLATKAFPSTTEAYKTTSVVKIPLESVRQLHESSEVFRDRYRLLFELREKFQYHLLNCSSYPPQAVASLLRALIYQERGLGNQPKDKGVYVFDLPIDVISRACQLNQRTVEQVLKGLQKVGLIAPLQTTDVSEDIIKVIDPEGLKEVYSATRDKVSWWPLK